LRLRCKKAISKAIVLQIEAAAKLIEKLALNRKERCAKSGIAEMSAAHARCWRLIAKLRHEKSSAPCPLIKAGMPELVNLIPLLPYRGFGPRS
jgi:hypothetical protein